MDENHKRPVWAEIHLDHIRHNAVAIREKVGDSEIIGVVKANAYGHGAVEVGRTLLTQGFRSLGVSTLEEAVELRMAGIEAELVLLGLTPWIYHSDIIRYNLTPAVSSYMSTRDLSTLAVQAKKTISVLVAIETGMGRIGLLPNQNSITEITGINRLPNIHVKGLFSHLATADNPDQTFAREQLRVFEQFAAELRLAGVAAPYLTMANSAAIMTLPESYYSAVRPGIALYGCYPSNQIDQRQLSLKPALSLKANIIFIKKLPAGFSISYDRQFTTARDSVIATLPLGYADGYPRALSNIGRVLVHGRFAPVVGRICMDQLMIDVTDIPEVRKYDEAVLIGCQEGQCIPVEELAEKTGTINYEILARIGSRIPRIYLDPSAGADGADGR